MALALGTGTQIKYKSKIEVRDEVITNLQAKEQTKKQQRAQKGTADQKEREEELMDWLRHLPIEMMKILPEVFDKTVDNGKTYYNPKALYWSAPIIPQNVEWPLSQYSTPKGIMYSFLRNRYGMFVPKQISRSQWADMAANNPEDYASFKEFVSKNNITKLKNTKTNSLSAKLENKKKIVALLNQGDPSVNGGDLLKLMIDKYQKEIEKLSEYITGKESLKDGPRVIARGIREVHQLGLDRAHALNVYQEQVRVINGLRTLRIKKYRSIAKTEFHPKNPIISFSVQQQNFDYVTLKDHLLFVLLTYFAEQKRNKKLSFNVTAANFPPMTITQDMYNYWTKYNYTKDIQMVFTQIGGNLATSKILNPNAQPIRFTPIVAGNNIVETDPLSEKVKTPKTPGVKSVLGAVTRTPVSKYKRKIVEEP